MSKTYLITGAGSGIGAAIALRLAEPGRRLILHTGSNRQGLDSVVELCAERGAEAEGWCGDLADAEARAELTGRCRDLPRLDGLVANAGFPDWRAFESLDAEGFNRSLQVVTTANFALLDALLPQLKAAERGSVVGISSFLAHKFKLGANVVPASAAAKAGLEALIKSFAAQYAADGICANLVVPGYIRKNAPNHTAPDEATLRRITARIPAGRLGLPEEVAELVAFLLSDRSAYLTGQSIHIDGGLMLQ